MFTMLPWWGWLSAAFALYFVQLWIDWDDYFFTRIAVVMVMCFSVFVGLVRLVKAIWVG